MEEIWYDKVMECVWICRGLFWIVGEGEVIGDVVDDVVDERCCDGGDVVSDLGDVWRNWIVFDGHGEVLTDGNEAWQWTDAWGTVSVWV